MTPSFQNDIFGGQRHYTGPAYAAFPITPDDNNDLPAPVRRIWVGTAGNLAVILRYGPTYGTVASPVTLLNLGVGYHDLGATRVLATGTTAANLVGLI
jgi:hypothetical protein